MVCKIKRLKAVKFHRLDFIHKNCKNSSNISCLCVFCDYYAIFNRKKSKIYKFTVEKY